MQDEEFLGSFRIRSREVVSDTRPRKELRGLTGLLNFSLLSLASTHEAVRQGSHVDTYDMVTFPIGAEVEHLDLYYLLL